MRCGGGFRRERKGSDGAARQCFEIVEVRCFFRGGWWSGGQKVFQLWMWRCVFGMVYESALSMGIWCGAPNEFCFVFVQHVRSLDVESLESTASSLRRPVWSSAFFCCWKAGARIPFCLAAWNTTLKLAPLTIELVRYIAIISVWRSWQWHCVVRCATALENSFES